MPLYDYLCYVCNHNFEFQKKLNECDPTCPKCKNDNVGKIFHTAPMTRIGNSSHVGKPFFSEKEVESRYGKKWRETAKNNPWREGGDRKKDYFHK